MLFDDRNGLLMLFDDRLGGTGMFLEAFILLELEAGRDGGEASGDNVQSNVNLSRPVFMSKRGNYENY